MSRAPSYLSPGWWAAVADLLPDRAPADLVVTHRVTGVVAGAAGGEASHTQSFAGGRLVGWRPGPDPHADLVVARDRAVDAGDLLGRADASEGAAATTLGLPGAPNRVTGIWGVGPWLVRRLPCVPPDLAIDVGLAVTGTPLGDVRATLGLRGSELVAGPEPAAGEPELRLTAAYDTVLEWLHGPDATTRQLLWTGALVGEILPITALSGVVGSRTDAEVEEWQRRFHDVAGRWAAARLHAGSIEVLDRVDELTAPAAPTGDLARTPSR
jgi:hypothetical protein